MSRQKQQTPPQQQQQQQPEKVAPIVGEGNIVISVDALWNIGIILGLILSILVVTYLFLSSCKRWTCYKINRWRVQGNDKND